MFTLEMFSDSVQLFLTRTSVAAKCLLICHVGDCSKLGSYLRLRRIGKLSLEKSLSTSPLALAALEDLSRIQASHEGLLTKLSVSRTQHPFSQRGHYISPLSRYSLEEDTLATSPSTRAIVPLGAGMIFSFRGFVED